MKPNPNIDSELAGQLKTPHTVFPVGKRPWIARALAGLVIGAGVLMAGQVQAHEPSMEQTHVQAAEQAPDLPATHISSLMWQPSTYPNHPYVDLGVIDSRQGEDKDDYMLRVGQILDRFTAASGHEGCGVIMENEAGDAWRVRLITNRSQVACVRMIFDEPGYLFTDETIHSHPQPRHGRVYANIQDQRLRGFQCGRGLMINDEDFSPGDLENGAGYLVARGQLLYHRDGVKTVVGQIEPVQSIEGLAQIPNETGRMSAPRSQRTMLSSMVQASYILAWSKSDAEGLPQVSCRQPKNIGK